MAEVEEEPETEVPLEYENPSGAVEQIGAVEREVTVDKAVNEVSRQERKRSRRRKKGTQPQVASPSAAIEQTHPAVAISPPVQVLEIPSGAPTSEPSGPPMSTEPLGPLPKRSQRVLERRKRRTELGGVAMGQLT